MSKTSVKMGSESEDLAARFLIRQGYRIVDRNYRTKRGEIDLIAYDGDTLVFIEVKSKSGSQFGGPQWALNGRKRMRISRSAEQYLLSRGLNDQICRFDLVAIQSGIGRGPQIDLIRNAFGDGGDWI